jgi:spore coat polysaccharide biosynthesis protein SpsF
MKLPKIGIVTQARTGSSRLPGKVLNQFCGVPLLQFQIDLIRTYNFEHIIVVATTTNHDDQKIVELCKQINTECFLGSENDVFDRYCSVAEYYKFDHIVRLTADNPLVSYSIINEAISSHLTNSPDLTSTRELVTDRTIKRHVPKGLSIDIINCKTLLSVDSEKLNKFEKEHVIPVFYNGKFQVNIIKQNFKYNDDLSIDTLDDFNRVQNFTKSLIKEDKLFEFLGYG